jgi:DNA-binding LacI/PurR family transcriptional regulator
MPPTKKAATNMRTVALRAGVSSATVSRVINGSPTVKEKAAQRVRRVIEELNFIPNPSATTLKYGRSKTYGLIIPDLTNPFFPEFLLHFEDVLVENDHELLVATIQASEEKLISSVRRMLMRRVDGVVLMASEFDTKAIEPLFLHNIPVVTVDRRRAQRGSGDVAIDFEHGYQQAVLHLRELGHRRIGFIGGNEGLTTSQIRAQAFEKAVKDAHLPYSEALTRAGNYRVAGGADAMRSLLQQKIRPTAVLTANDLTAFGVLRALHAAGVDVPAQMSVVGCDGILLSDSMYPSLTTISIPLREMAQACVTALEHTKLNITKKGLLLSVRGSLTVRDSTSGPPR